MTITKPIIDGLIDFILEDEDYTIIKETSKETHPHKFKVKQIESELKKLPYENQVERVSEVENAHVPPFIVPFYSLLMKYHRLPSYTELIREYEKRFLIFDPSSVDCYLINERYREHFGKSPLNILGLQGRIMRAYPSFIRDLHLFLFCKECYMFDKVVYSLRESINGLNLLLVYEGEPFYLKLYISTKRAETFMGREKEAHYYPNARSIELGAEMSNRSIGEFIVYEQKDIYTIITKMEGVA